MLEVAPASYLYDCHGWTFTGGEKWINNDQVPTILEDNGYSAVSGGQAQVGDLVIYREFGKIKRSGIVTAVDGAGNATQIESKWGCYGLYRHPPWVVPAGYGEPEYWRTSRPGGHRLISFTPQQFLLLLLLLLLLKLLHAVMIWVV